ncbi:acyl carrier protein [Selenomonas sp. KH1T6]|uniref:acyl carrier protein n=1 Tax=Selenomonas sp. KH1T6 TaxID=3158784 RepID=UPI0008A7E2FA|nr:hypothetical protein SAMN05216583_10858 [Selenomonas ruminantium]
MSNEEKYVQSFVNAFGVEESGVPALKFNEIEEWDSVGHMSLIAEIEEAFDIMMETEDIIDLSSYEKGKEILSGKYDVQF